MKEAEGGLDVGRGGEKTSPPSAYGLSISSRQFTGEKLHQKHIKEGVYEKSEPKTHTKM